MPSHTPDIVPPEDLEAAAVTAALMVFTTGGGTADEVRATPRWRFSGRWWAKPVPLRRDRP